ncbi:hypothetical protein [Rhizobium sp. Root1204]|uniref:hypothetical protein n=1 Tax=Rhizobium sp. Root1204 TaxID=1736428 RepID=UPI001FCE2D9D|nr:hypothetical protein [Rhizobium sp. Root1204]
MASKDRAFEVGEREIRLTKDLTRFSKSWRINTANVVFDKRLPGYGDIECICHVRLSFAAGSRRQNVDGVR